MTIFLYTFLIRRTKKKLNQRVLGLCMTITWLWETRTLIFTRIWRPLRKWQCGCDFQDYLLSTMTTKCLLPMETTLGEQWEWIEICYRNFLLLLIPNIKFQSIRSNILTHYIIRTKRKYQEIQTAKTQNLRIRMINFQ